MATIAILRDPAASLAACELSFVNRSAIDLGRAFQQHEAYAALLMELGCTVRTLPAEAALPDSVFVEDTALVLDELAVLTRPGAASRREEVASIAAALSPFRALKFLVDPATLDGGDVLRLDREIHVGLSGRSNGEAIEQLTRLLSPWGYGVHPHRIHGCLHLKSAVTRIGTDLLLVQPDWVNPAEFGHWRLIEVDPTEPHAANGLLIGETLVYPSCFPRTRARIEAAGVKVRDVDVSELQKAEGAVTCCSLVFES